MHGRLIALPVLLCGLLLTAAGQGADKEEPAPEYPQVGALIPGPFHVLNLNGERKRRYHCLVCRNSIRPTAALFVRLRAGDDAGLNQLDTAEPLAKLIKALDVVSDKYLDAYLGTFAVFLLDKEEDQLPLEQKLEELTKEAKLKQIVFAVETKEGAKPYFAEPKDANAKALKWDEPGVKVLLYSNFKVIEMADFNKERPLTDKDVAAFEQTFRQMVPADFGVRKKLKLAAP